MADQVGGVPVEFRRQDEQLAFAAGIAIAPDIAAIWPEADARTRLWDKRAVRLEQIGAGERATCRVHTAWCIRGIGIADADLTAGRNRRRADVADEDAIGNAVRSVYCACRIRIDDDETVVLAKIRSTRRVVVLLMGIFEVDGNVAATVGKVLAGDCRQILVARIAIFADAGLTMQIEAVVIFLENEVDDPGDGIRAVYGRVATRHDVDLLDQIGRERVDVWAVAVVDDLRRDMASAVYQDESPRRAKTAKIEQVKAANAEAARRVLRTHRAAQLRQIVENVADGNTARRKNVRSGHGRDRVGRLIIRTTNTRSGNQDLFYLGAFPLRCLGWHGAIRVHRRRIRVGYGLRNGEAWQKRQSADQCGRAQKP